MPVETLLIILLTFSRSYIHAQSEVVLLKISEHKETRSLTHYESLLSSSSSHCIMSCLMDDRCHVAGYHKVSRTCEKTDKYFMNPPSKGTSHQWTLYNLEKYPGKDCCYSGICYSLVTNTMTWYNAKSHCETTGGQLASIHTADQNDFVVQCVQSMSAGEQVYIGGTDAYVEGIFQWPDDSVVSGGFTNWRPGQPDDAGGSEDCLHLDVTTYYTWNDISCLTLFASLCEYQ